MILKFRSAFAIAILSYGLLYAVQPRYRYPYGAVWHIEALNGRLWASNGGNIINYAISDEEFMEEKTEIETPGDAYDFCFLGDLLIVADNYQGLVLYDVSNSGSPQLLCELNDFQRAFCVEPLGNARVVVSDPARTLVSVLNLANADEPRVEAELNIGFIVDLAIWGNIIYALDIEGALHVLKFSGGKIDVVCEIYDIDAFSLLLDHPYLYVNAWGTDVWNIQTPGCPIHELTMDIWGDYAFKQETQLFVIQQDMMYIYDISNMNQPSLLHEEYLFYRGQTIKYFDQKIYLGTSTGGLAIYNYNMARPAVAPSFLQADPKGGLSYRLEKNADTIAIAQWMNGAALADLQGKHLRQLGTNYLTWHVEIIGQALITAEDTGASHWDISNPIAPTLLHDVDIDNCIGIEANGNDLFFISKYYGIYVYQMDGMNTPIYLAFIENADARRLSIHEKKLYVLSEQSGYYLYDIKDAMNPVFLGKYLDKNTYIINIAIKNNILFTSEYYNKRVRIYRMDEKGAPELISEVAQEAPLDIQIYGNSIFVIEDYFGIIQYDVWNLEKPEIISETEIPLIGPIYEGLIDGGMLYYTAGYSGVIGYSINDFVWPNHHNRPLAPP